MAHTNVGYITYAYHDICPSSARIFSFHSHRTFARRSVQPRFPTHDSSYWVPGIFRGHGCILFIIRDATKLWNTRGKFQARNVRTLHFIDNILAGCHDTPWQCVSKATNLFIETSLTLLPVVLSFESFKQKSRCLTGFWWARSATPWFNALWFVRWPTAALKAKSHAQNRFIKGRFNHIIPSSSWKQCTKRGFSP